MRQALDLWMAGCMVSVFAALAEFVVVKVLDVQYQYQVNRIPKVLPMVSFILCCALINKKKHFLYRSLSARLRSAQRISNMEKGQCATVASWEGGAVRSRKATQTPTTPGQVSCLGTHAKLLPPLMSIYAWQIEAYEQSAEPSIIYSIFLKRFTNYSSLLYLQQTSLQGNGGPPKPARRQSLLSVAWTDTDTGVEKIMWREIDKVSRAVFPILFFVFVLLYWPILLMKSS